MEYICKVCGKTDNSERWIDGDQMAKDQLCFECNFWLGQNKTDLSERKDHKYAIIKGEHYVLTPHTDGPFRGFDGAKTRITFFDGTIKECDNLWHQGEIPERFRDIMPDNATLEWL